MRVAEALHGLGPQEGGDQSLVALQKFVRVGDGAVSPTLLVAGEGDAAELGYEDGFAFVSVARDVDGSVRRLSGDG